MAPQRRKTNTRSRPIPKHVDVAGSRVDIEIKTEKQDHTLKTCWGYYNDATNKITINRRARGDTRWWVYHHELAHAWLHKNGGMFILQQIIPVKNPGIWELIEETIVRVGMVPHSLSLRG